MEKIFIPYRGRRPAAVSINGHHLIILSPQKEVLEEDLAIVGADRIKEIPWEGSDEERERILGKLALKTQSGVIVAEDGQNITELLNSLRQALPWVQ